MIKKVWGALPFSAPITANSINFVANTYVANLNIFSNNGLQYRLFLEIQKNYTGLYSCETTNEEFLDYENDFYKYLWTLTEMFVTYINGEFQFWEIIKIYNVGLKVMSVDARLISEVDSEESKPIYNFVNNIHGIYVRWGTTRMSAYFQWYPVIEQIATLLVSANCSSDFDAKKFVRIVNHTNLMILEKEKEQLRDPTNPFITVYKKLATYDANGKVEQIEKVTKGTEWQEIKSESKTNQLYLNLGNLTSFWYNIIGLAVPQQNRESGKTDIEGTTDVYNTLAIEKVTIRELKKFERQAKKLWNIDLNFKKNIDLEKIYKEVTNGDNISTTND